MTANETFRNATRDGGFKHGAKSPRRNGGSRLSDQAAKPKSEPAVRRAGAELGRYGLAGLLRTRVLLTQHRFAADSSNMNDAGQSRHSTNHLTQG